MRRPASGRRPPRARDRLPLERVAGDVLCLRGGRHRALLEAGSVPLALMPEREQERLLASYRAFLASLDYPLQVLVRAVPADVERYLAALAGSAARGGALARLGRDHAAFVRRLARERGLIERRRYVVVPAEEGGAVRLPPLSALPWPGRRRRPDAGPGRELERARRTLERRSEQVAAGLGACGVAARRLGGAEIAALWRELLGAEPAPEPAPEPAAAATALLEERPGAVSAGGELSRVLALTDYPRHVAPHWLGGLLELDEPVDLSLHLEPLDPQRSARDLTRRLAELESSRRIGARSGRLPSAAREAARSDVERLRGGLARGEERLLRAGLYLRLRGRSRADLRRAEARARAALAPLPARARPALYEMLPGLISSLPAGEDHLRRRVTLDSASAATMIPFAAAELPPGPGLLYGSSLRGGSPVVLDPFGPGQPNANKVVVAASGAGKSYACKVEALRALLLGIEYSVIDPEGEYGAICDAVGGERLRLSGSAPHRLNPFELPPEPAAGGGDALAGRVLALHGLLALMLAEPGRELGQAERGALDRALYACYRRAGITEDPATHGRPAPLLRDLASVLEASGEPHGLAARLARYASGSLGRLFSEPAGAAPRGPVVVFDLEGLEAELRPLATYLIADRLWGEVRRDPRPRMLLIDEAWSLMRHAEGARFVARVARGARKRWLGLTTVTQEVSDFLAAPEGRAVLGQSATRLLLRQESATVALLQESFALSERERSFLLGCRPGEGLLLARGSRVALRVEASPGEHELCTTDPAELHLRRAGAGA